MTLNTVARMALLFALVVAALIAAGAFGWRQVSAEVTERAQAEADRAVASVSQQLVQADRVYGPLTRATVRTMRNEGVAEAAARLGQSALRTAAQRKAESRAVDALNARLDAIGDRYGGVSAVYSRRGPDLTALGLSLKDAHGARVAGPPIARDSEISAALAAGRTYAGPFEILGRPYYARFEAAQAGDGGRGVVLAALYPLDPVDELSRELATSPVFRHGFLAVVDSRGRPLFRSSHSGPSWLDRRFDDLTRAAVGAPEAKDGYRLLRTAKGRWGLNIVAAAYEPDLRAQTVRLVGGSLSVLAVVIVLALSLAWLLARRLTAALEDAHRSRRQAEEARIAAETANSTLAAELDQAARYVESLLPGKTRSGPVLADWLYRPSAGVGGDAFGYLWLDETHFAFYLLDVCGHGVGAALLATTVMNTIRSRNLGGADFSAPASVLGGLNAVFQMGAHNDMYFTIWYGVYDTATMTVTFAAAGHHPAVLVAPDAAPQLLQGRGVPIGCFEEVTYPEFTVDVPPGARLYVFSDGMFEVELRTRQEMFSFEEFVNLIMEWQEKFSDRELVFVLEAVQDLQGKTSFDDDCALMELAFNPVRQLEIAA